MKKHNLDDMVGGWFIGHFEPTLLKTDDFEVAVKIYKKGDYEENHYHKIATEYTLIMDGEVIMSGEKYSSGDIVVIKPNESVDFRALTDVKTVVVKTPSVANDKYLK
jgi:quercetin dioxygenase-like cupin family protein